AAPLLPEPATIPVLVLGGGLWLWSAWGSRPRREIWLVILGGLVALSLLVGGTIEVWRAPRGLAAWARLEEPRYRQLWNELSAACSQASSALGATTFSSSERRSLFRRLAALVAASPDPRLTLLLFNPDGEAFAWAGRGLVNGVGARQLDAQGPDFRASFSSATLFVRKALSSGQRSWWLIAGLSAPTDRLPFAAPAGEQASAFRWSLLPTGGEKPARGLVLAPPELPILVAQTSSGSAIPTDGKFASRFRRWAWWPLGAMLLLLALSRGLGVAILASTRVKRHDRKRSVVPPLLAGTIALAAASAVPWRGIVFLAASGWLAAEALASAWRRGARPRAAELRAALGTLVILGLAWSWQHFGGPIDLGASFGADPITEALRVAMVALTLGLLSFAARGEGSGAVRTSTRSAWFACVLLLAAAATHDLFWLAALFLVAAAAAAGHWLARGGVLRSPSGVALMVLFATLLSGSAWQAAYRLELRQRIATRWLPAMAPPTPLERAAMTSRIERAIRAADLDSLAPRAAAGLDLRDLAYALWRETPLARGGALSAVVVKPPGGAAASVFSFGLPMRGDTVDWSPARWEEQRLPVWQGSRIEGTAILTRHGEVWGQVRYWWLPRPGFRLVRDRRQDLAAGLLAGGASALRPAAQVLEPAVYALYAPSGRVRIAPWRGASPAAPAAQGGRGKWVSTPKGPAWAFARRDRDGLEALFLPALGPLAGMERVAICAFGSLLLILGLALAAFVLALTRRPFRGLLVRIGRSYTRRVLVAYTLLLVIPLLLLTVVLLRGAGARLERGQRAAGEAALDSAQRVLGEYVLSLQPGFGVGTALDDELLVWLSRVVHHEVNLYWGSELYASSRRELLTAGLVPKRIPGEVYARLALAGSDLVIRTNLAGGIPFLELYEPFKVPGVGEQERLFLSLPMLSQQREVKEELVAESREAVLVASALFLLLLVLGGRLARNFARPLEELVAGTQRIAAGASSLAYSPEETELAALATAIDRMARRIADARRGLVREKQVVERIVENITAGIVSLDAERRVLLRNRVAADLLGVGVGEALDEALDRRAELHQVAEFVTPPPRALVQTAVRLGSGAAEREWSLVWVPLPGGGEPSA
ncbi:MAG TPA: HAMP domain-containing protein, partial [Thermoanaerobaculia bacterium]|nr:HAMP domain-containing protein [Thermoanaerobaculia bacterium]